MAYDSIWDRIEEECGVFGIYDPDTSVPLSAYYGLFALQHRGQESDDDAGGHGSGHGSVPGFAGG